MKMLTHREPISIGRPFELAEIKATLRIDFPDDDLEIERTGWAAAAELEQFAQIALLHQTIRLTVFSPNPLNSNLILPIGPVDEADVPTVAFDGVEVADFAWVGGNRPCIRWSESYRHRLPTRIAIEYRAGFGATAADIPRDLMQALIDQAALLFAGRSPMDGKTLTSSPHMARIGARYRGVRM